MNEELLDKLEKGHTFEIGENDTIIWQLNHWPTQQEAEGVIDVVSEEIPGADHLVVADLEQIYLVKDADVDTE